MNFRKKMRISYSHQSKRQDRNNWHKRGEIKDIEYKKKTQFKYKETLALPPCTAGDNSIIVQSYFLFCIVNWLRHRASL